MWRGIVLSILIAGCSQLPLSPADIQARKFESVPDKAAIYLVRDSLDSSDAGTPIRLDGRIMITTYPGNYYRWEVPAGSHQIEGTGIDTGRLTVNVQNGRIYFVHQQVEPAGRDLGTSSFNLTSEEQGRALVLRATLVAP